MPMLLRGGWLVEFEPASVEAADLRIDNGRIIARGPNLPPQPDDLIVNVWGRLVLPGLVSAHHHFHGLMLRQLTRTGDGFDNEQQLLERIEDVMDLDDVRAVAAASALEGLANGTTTVFAAHASPAAVSGALTYAAHGVAEVGLRSVMSWEVSERSGPEVREAALAEIVGYCSMAQGPFAGALGLTRIDTLSDETLKAVAAAREAQKLHVMANLSETPDEERQSQAKFGRTTLDRLGEVGLIGPTLIASQGVHFSWPELSQVLASGSWLAHAPRSNMAKQAGTATAGKFGVRGCLATDVMSLDVLAEAKTAWLRARDAGQPIDVLRFLANGHRLASATFGVDAGPLREGAIADLLILDYVPATELSKATLAQHVIHGFTTGHIESVMVEGQWRLWNRKPVTARPFDITARARASVNAVASRLGQAPVSVPAPAPAT